MPRDDILVWCDIETMNLSAKSPMLELGFRITDLDTRPIDKISWLIWDDFYMNEWEDVPEVVHSMHTANGLFEEAKDLGRPKKIVEKYAINFLRDGGWDGQPLAGSSVHTDRMWIAAQMPELLQSFHYRNIDTSTIKELCRRINPRIYELLPPKRELHRVDPDLLDSCVEYKHYLDNFLWDGRE